MVGAKKSLRYSSGQSSLIVQSSEWLVLMRINRLRSYQKWIITVLAVLLIAGLTVGGLWATNALGWRAWRLQEVQAFIGASVPEDASDIHFATQNTHTRIIWLRFTLSPGSDVTAFLNQMGISGALKSGFTPFPAPNPQEAGMTWWIPNAANQYAGLYHNDGRKIEEVLADNSDPAQMVVYVRAYNIGTR